MNAEKYELRIKRILVALDTSTDSLAALEAAAQMAAALQAELLGLFVEDINLLRLANLPFASEVQRATGAGRRLSQDSMERDLRLQASQARRALAEAAARAEAEWRFRVVRGVVQKEVLEAALEADLLTLGRTSRSFVRRRRLGSTARAAVSGAPRSVFLSYPRQAAQEPIYVTFDGSPAGETVLHAAAHLAHLNESELVVLLMPRPDETGQKPSAAGLAEQGEELLRQHLDESDIRYRELPADDSEALVEALQSNTCSLLVLGGETPLLQGEQLQTLLDELTCPVMLVR